MTTVDPSAARPTIRLTGVTKLFSGVAALSDVTVAFHPGEVHAILGENGAGKSTLMNIIAGVLQPELGEMEFAGQRAQAMTPEKAAALGIAISYQHPAILEDLSVLENLQVALPDVVFADGATVAARRMLDDVGLDVPLNIRAQDLTISQRHLL